MKPDIELLGAYRVENTKDLFKKAWDTKFGGIKLGEKQKQDAKRFLRQELSSIVLIEVIVKNHDQDFDVGDFLQEESDQVAYDEAFLSIDGSEVISRFNQPNKTELRIVFFLHFFDPAKPIKTSYGDLNVKSLDDMPSRLSELVPYEPVG